MTDYIIAKILENGVAHPTFLYKGIRIESPVFGNYFDAVNFLVRLQSRSEKFNDYEVHEVKIEYTFIV